jgi:hypothetical protein
MAVFRPNITCPLCGGDIPFVYNKLTKEQIENGWCGDQGGDYGSHDCIPQIREKKINKIINEPKEEFKK